MWDFPSQFWVFPLEYKFLKRIGSGASAKVYKIMKRSDKSIYAVKMIRIKDWEMQDLEQEITLMTFCKHECIVRYYETFFFNEFLLLNIQNLIFHILAVSS